MTVKELINELKEYPKDSKIMVYNDEMYIDGAYDVRKVSEYVNGTVLIESDFENRME